MKIKNISANEILNSRGVFTVSASCELENGIVGKASVPSGASTGKHEAHELRDNKGSVGEACENVEKIISPNLKGVDVSNQARIDEIMLDLDGTTNKSKLGANAILAVSIAAIRTHSLAKKKELFEIIGEVYGFSEWKMPKPLSVIIEGGKHSDSNADIQEYMICMEDNDIKSNLNKITTIYKSLGEILEDKGKNTNVGYEGAYGPKLSSNKEALDFIIQAIQNSNFSPGKNVKMSLDIASSEFYDNDKYLLHSENIALSSHQMVAYLEDIVTSYPILSIEDGMAEDDWDGWQHLRERLGNKILLVGDDLFVTNTERIRNGIDKNAANAVLIKPNQIGTVSETVEAIKMTKFSGWESIISHRSGETNDTFIADLAVSVGASYIKAGAPVRGERVSKYNRLMEISEIIGN